LLVGTLDITAAIIQTLYFHRSIAGLFRYIASAIYGPEAMSGSWTFVLMGAGFHYFIALCWTLLFFTLAQKFTWSRFNPAIIGIVYGLFIWVVMNLIVVPASQIGSRPFDLGRSAFAAGILMVAIGIPLAVINKRRL